jgi:(p)ppGpp synthase/HD superfamily hydrolase
MNPIIKAVQLANLAHVGQIRKYNGRPYITHPLRVMNRYMLLPDATMSGACAAVLHDTIEDTNLTKQSLEKTFSDAGTVAGIVVELTNPSKLYPELKRAERKAMDREHIHGASLTARQIKLIDRRDNLCEMDPAGDPSFAALYLNESDKLLDALRGTDAVLEDELHGAIERLSTMLP